MKSAYEILTSSKKFHISLGLDRVKKVLNLLGNPQEKYKCFHIAGTNGKGSVSKIINDILIENFKGTNVKTGLFTSPHLFSYTERIKINNNNIKEDDFNNLINHINDFALSNNIELTEFEILTVAGFYWFYKNNVSYVVLETGLGGTLDATNVISSPIVSVITSIDFDHTERLGNTTDEIALQKAGIIKKSCPVVISPQNKGYNVILSKAKENNSKLIQIPKIEITYKNGINTAIIDYKDKKEEYEFNLLGSHQADNLSLALAAIKASNIKTEDSIIKNALKNVVWKFRIEYNKSKNLIIDGAHNPSGIAVLRKFLDENFKNQKKTFIFGCLKNKDYEKMLETLINKDDKFYFYEFDYPNALKYKELPEKYKNNSVNLTSINEVEKVITTDMNLKIVCGSLYMLGKLYNIL